MFRLIGILAAFLAANFALMTLVVRLAPLRYDWSDANSDSVIMAMPEGERYDFVLMGTSHARTFARGSHDDVSAILGLRHFNLARGGGGGLVPALVYLDYFYLQGNRADAVVYMLDPYIFFSPQWNEQRYFAQDEPLRWDFLRLLFRYDVSPGAIWNHVQSKYTWRWFKRPEEEWEDKKERALERSNPESGRLRVESLYLDGTQEAVFERYRERLEQFVELCRSHGSRMVFFYPPTLLGVQPGQELLTPWLERLASENGDIVFEDHSMSVLNPAMYYNQDHLNSEGVRHVTRRILAPLLKP